jgi:protocatechuate 3,4-dioxygenase beta subunit
MREGTTPRVKRKGQIMSVKVLVTDRNANPVKQAKVYVHWEKGGKSEEYTNSNGIADLKCSGGVLDLVRVNGYDMFNGRRRVGDDETFPIEYNR